jgi:hypothetical protein
LDRSVAPCRNPSCSQSRRRLSGCARCSSLRNFSYQRRRYA